MDIRSNIDKFKRQGFLGLGTSLLSSEEVNKLSELINKEFEATTDSHSDCQDTGMNCIVNLLEQVPYSEIVVNKVVSNPLIRELLEEVLGVGYKVWSVGARRSFSGDRGLYLHQDGVGQVNMFISLDDNLTGEGSSILLPSSHLIKTSMKKWKVEMPPALLNLLPFMFERLSGLRGGVSIFSNRIWHGRSRNSSSLDHDILTIGFFPAGYHYGPGISADLATTYSKKELSGLLGRPSDLPGTITSNCECRESGNIQYFGGKSFSLNIENYAFLSKLKKPTKLIFSLITIRFLMYFVTIARLLKKIIGK
jgi:putative 2OG-Fe(II) oxygenase